MIEKLDLPPHARIEFLVLGLISARHVIDLVQPPERRGPAQEALDVAERIAKGGSGDLGEIRAFIGTVAETVIQAQDYEIDRRLGVVSLRDRATPTDRFAVTAVVSALSAVLAAYQDDSVNRDHSVISLAANAVRVAQAARETVLTNLIERHLPEPQDGEVTKARPLHG